MFNLVARSGRLGRVDALFLRGFVVTGCGLDIKAGFFPARIRTRARTPCTMLRDSGWGGARLWEEALPFLGPPAPLLLASSPWAGGG